MSKSTPLPGCQRDLLKAFREEQAKAKILYIHGFKSSGNARKAQILQKYFKVISADLPVSALLSIKLLQGVIAEEKPQFIIGSSLGGFYALVLGSQLEIPVLLINPAVFPSESLMDQVGEHERFVSGEKFMFREQDLIELREMESWWKLEDSHFRNLFLAMDDELLDAKQSFAIFEKHCNSMRTFEKGGHQFNCFESTIGLINDLIAYYADSGK
jgi:uncharacterized protein